MKQLILGIVGEKSSGKSVIGAYLRRERSVSFVRFSDVLNEILRILTLDERNRLLQGALAEALRKTFGKDILAKATVFRARQHRARLIVIDGIRSRGELKYLRRFKNFRLLYVTAPFRLRYKRARHRNIRRDDRVSLVKFKKIESLPHEREIPAIGRQADIRIDNIGTTKELLAEVDADLKQLRFK